MRIWLHEGTANEPGWFAWGLDHLGFGTWAPTREGVLRKVFGKLEEHLEWLAGHGIVRPAPAPGIEVEEEVAGDEVLFARDREPAAPDEIDETLRLLVAAREDLLATIAPLPDRVLDWDPPYQNFLPWADWRTIRATLAHLATTESWYYLRNLGFEPTIERAAADGDWREFLAAHREAVVPLLEGLREAEDRVRLHEVARGAWSVRKSLRRLVWHERLHTKSIRRIVREYDAARGGF